MGLKKRIVPYIGGQMEIQNQVEAYLYRGEIESIAIKNNALQVRFRWLAKGEGFPPLPHRWIKADKPLDYVASLAIYHESGSGDDRLCFESRISNELVVLFPKGGSRLDPSKVEGLEALT